MLVLDVLQDLLELTIDQIIIFRRICEASDDLPCLIGSIPTDKPSRRFGNEEAQAQDDRAKEYLHGDWEL